MPKDQHEIPLTGEVVDRKTWARIKTAMDTLTKQNPLPYTVEYSFFSINDALMDEKDLVIGTASQSGDLETGWVRYARLDQVSAEFLEKTRQENLWGVVEFAKQSGNTYFHGTLLMRDFASGVGEINLDTHGYAEGQDSDIGFDFTAFAIKVGLTKQWAQVYDQASSGIEQQFSGNVDPQTSLSIAYALTSGAQKG